MIALDSAGSLRFSTLPTELQRSSFQPDMNQLTHRTERCTGVADRCVWQWKINARDPVTAVVRQRKAESEP